ncbi:transposase [Paenibacillus aceti]|uniref:Transposase n=1 Tax=Paenibacillus aceti TaxID=1820010 RepID=A0ABQ1VT07_9BACL|nr:transposase [Paenibacillus aceti]GGF94143.1 hypothetical protein GCM10010913_14580 [Paenibacillus aceti]
MTKKYDKEFKMETVRLIQEEGKSVAQVAREMDLHQNTIYQLQLQQKLNSGTLMLDSSQYFSSLLVLR